MSNPSDSNGGIRPPRPIVDRSRPSGPVSARRVPSVGAPSGGAAARTSSDPERTRVLGARDASRANAAQTSPIPRQAAHATPAHGAPRSRVADGRRESDGARPPRPGNRGAKVAVAAVAGGVALAYVAGVVAFSNICYPGTNVAGADISLMGAGAAAEAIERSVDGYELEVSGLGFKAVYAPEPGTFAIDAAAEAKAVLAGNEPLIWPIRLVRSLARGDEPAGAPRVEATFDREALAQSVGAAVDAFNEGRAGTFDAAGAYDPDAGSFTVARARSNQRLSKEAVVDACERAAARAAETVRLDESAYEPLAGGATDEQLQAACDAANQIIGVDVDLTMGGQTVATLDGSTMTQWITFDESLAPTLDAEALSGWIRQLAAEKLDTAGSQRTYTRPDGKKVTVSGGTYGWISDEAALAELIQKAVAEKQTGTIEVPTKQTADLYAGVGVRDWGAYVDVDLTEQHVRYYDANDALIWESGCITGNPNHNNQTPTGIYFINSNSGGALLVGADEDKDGEPDYKTPVSYWMSFIGGAVGLHDASWQAASSFSDPTAYMRVGSHGCVNLPPDKAAELHGLLHVGVCVITHE